jgi:ABC-2 type transport system permease protein
VITSLVSEWMKIRTTRTIFWLLVALVAIVTLFVVSGVITNDRSSLTGADNQIGALGIGILAPLIALIMGLVVSTGEFRHGTVTPTLLSTPSRIKVVASKSLASMLFGIALVAIAEALVVAELAALLPMRGVALVLDGGDVLHLLIRILTAAAIWGAIGSALGLALRNQIGTVVGCFTWLFFVEPILTSILHSHAFDSNAGRFLPLESTIAVFNTSGGGQHLLGHWAGLGVLCGWLALVTVAALALFGRRDVS